MFWNQKDDVDDIAKWTAIIADNMKAEEKIFIISKSNLNCIRSNVLKISVLVLAWKLIVSSHHVRQLKLIVFKSLNNPPKGPRK